MVLFFLKHLLQSGSYDSIYDRTRCGGGMSQLDRLEPLDATYTAKRLLRLPQLPEQLHHPLRRAVGQEVALHAPLVDEEVGGQAAVGGERGEQPVGRGLVERALG